jgi:hypothetical protein
MMSTIYVSVCPTHQVRLAVVACAAADVNVSITKPDVLVSTLQVYIFRIVESGTTLGMQ